MASKAGEAVADRRARESRAAPLPTLTPEVLMAYPGQQVDGDEGVRSLRGESFAFRAEPMYVATVLRETPYPGAFKHAAELGIRGAEI